MIPFKNYMIQLQTNTNIRYMIPRLIIIAIEALILIINQKIKIYQKNMTLMYNGYTKTKLIIFLDPIL
jgi:hypothetical protein